MVDLDGSSLAVDSQVGWLGLRVGGYLVISLHSPNEPGELWRCLAMITAP